MNQTFSPEVERLVHQHVDGKEFRTENDVLLAALHLFEQYRRHEQLRRDVKDGFDQIERGEAIELEDDALRTFFDDVKARGFDRGEAREMQ